MSPSELYWLKVGAIGQAAGAAATFLAVVASLYIAFRGRRPRLKLSVGKRLIFGGPPPEPTVLMFSVTNMGERPVHIRGIGWTTGWLRTGPTFLRRKNAVQITGGSGLGTDPPYEIQPGQEIASYTVLDSLLEYAGERVSDPFFSRDWPVLGRRASRVRAYAYTADGYTILEKPEEGLLSELEAAERKALNRTSDVAD